MPTTSKHANDDVIIASAEGKIYKISQAQLQQFPMLVDKTDPECRHILDLLDAGVTAAYMPPPPGANATGNAMCYLINLAGLNTKKTLFQD